MCTLRQLLAQFGFRLPALSIKDRPDFSVRGVMLDVSRDKVPTLDTLLKLVDMLADWKINHIELYTEHTFAYLKHETVWKEASPVTGEDILLLDRYCRERFIDLTPNQNSFGHMHRWLKHPEYKHLAEAPDGFDTPWGTRFDEPFSLCPGDAGSLKLLSGLYDELLPHFTSALVNVGLDETFDLGKGRSHEECERRGAGRVYLDFLLEIHDQVSRRGSRMLFWGDIILHHPELIAELPKDVIVLEWGYEASHPFKEHCDKFAATGLDFWVCPGTSSWSSITGRSANCIGNLRGAAQSGLAAGASGYLNTDWGDNGHLQYLPVSYLGFLYGAACSWNAAETGEGILKPALSLHAFGDPTGVTGRLFHDLGNVYLLIDKRLENTMVIFQQLMHPLSDNTPAQGVRREDFERVRSAVRDLAGAIDEARISTPDAATIHDEFLNAARQIELACLLGEARLDLAEGKDISVQATAIRRGLEQAISEHRRLWLLRNRPGGLPDSLKMLENRLDEVRT